MCRIKPDRLWFLWMIALVLAACAPVTLPASTAIPTQQVWNVTYPPETAWLIDSFDDCVQADWNIGIVIQEVMDAQVANQTGDIQLVWGDIDPQDFTAVQIGMDAIRLVVHPDSPVQEVTLEELRAVYSGTVRSWEEVSPAASGEIHGWIYPEYLSIQREFLIDLGGSVNISPYFNIAPDVKAMLEAVSADPLAIGLIPASWPDQGLNEIDVTNWKTAQIPLVALLKRDDPQISAWLGCLADVFPDR